MNRLYLLILAMMFLAGCATRAYPPSKLGRISAPGFYHEVEKGETLWNISKLYGVDLETIIEANRLPDASEIEVGQLIFIPGSREAKPKSAKTAVSNLENFLWPAKGTVISYYGSMNNLIKNKGIDIETREGADIVASRAGKVTFASDNLKGYGKTIIIDHLDGFETVYAHNAENLVAVDKSVTQGEIIAKAGTTGRVDKPTLHFEVRKDHKPQNPFYYLP